MPRSLPIAIAAAVVVPACAGPSSAGAAEVFGSDLTLAPETARQPCFTESPSVVCTRVAQSFHAGNAFPAQAPISGVVTAVRYRSNTADDATLRLARLNPAGQATGAGTGPTATLVAFGEITVVAVNPGLPIQQGDYLAGDAGPSTALNCANSGGTFDAYLPVLQDGAQPRTPQGPDRACEILIQGTIEPDSDGDTLGDETQDPDDDNDQVADTADNCPAVANPGQENTDGAPQGNACDPDDDNDGDPDTADNCPLVRNPTQADSDGDGLGNACDLTNGPSLPGIPTAELGRVVVAEAVSGTVTFARPRAAGAAANARGSQRGLNFVPLEEAREIPVGSFLNTRRGTVRLVSARDTAGNTQSGEFAGGVFQVLQSRARRARGLTELRLKGSGFRRCRTGRRIGAGAAQVSRRTIRRVRSNADGNFRTRGRHSAATVRGTVWTTADRCDGTLTTVRRGRVAVRDFRRKRTVIVRAGQSYLAKARTR
jgi:Thrombospondin type 3 repeat